MKFFIFMGLFLGCSSMAFEKSDHFDGSKFHNPWGNNNDKGLWDVLKWKMFSEVTPWESVKEFHSMVLGPRPEQSASITWVNHATFLIRTSTLNILIDPLWSDRTSPFTWAGPKRMTAPGVSWEHLPKIDLVLVSHNHYDHLDLGTLKKLSQRDRPIVLVPLGDMKWLKSSGVENVEEMDWWQTRDLKGSAITFLPAQHWSSRWPWDSNESLWGSWGIQADGLKLYHAGDTGLGPHFKMIEQRWGSPDVAMLPIGAYEPRWFMKLMHMNPTDAVEAMKELGAESALGMHFGTFQLTDEGRDQPVKDLAIALTKAGIDPARFSTPHPGETFNFSKRKQ